MPKLIPAILEKTAEDVQAKIDIFRELTLNMAHLDVMDGIAVSSSCWGDLRIASQFDVWLEIHLMVKNPLEEAKRWLELSNVSRVVVRGEEISLREYSILSRRTSELKKDKQLGIAFDPDSSLQRVLGRIAHLDYFLAMGVTSGYSGQVFNSVALENIRLVKKLWPGVAIGVDGGMNETTIPLVKQAGVSCINAASWFWAGGDIKKKIALVEGE